MGATIDGGPVTPVPFNHTAQSGASAPPCCCTRAVPGAAAIDASATRQRRADASSIVRGFADERPASRLASIVEILKLPPDNGAVWNTASLDSSSATGGVLELPGDDYFISTAAEGRAGCIPARSNRFVSAYRAPHVVCDKQRQYHIKRTVKGRII